MFLALTILTAARMVIGASSELSGDEAYYFLWSERLDWSYYSKGPGVALAIKLSTSIFGDTALGVRFLSPLLGLGTSILVFRLAKQLLGIRVGIGTVVMLNLTPIFNAGSIVLTIDPLMIFFWVAAMLTTWKAAHDDQKLSGYWLMTGLLIGIGFLCKYTALVQVVSIVLFLVAWPKGRSQFRRPGFYAMLGVILLSMTPVVIWNAQNDWITCRHLFERTGLSEKDDGFRLGPDIFVYLGYHLGVYTPLIFAGLAGATVIAIRRFRKTAQQTFLGSFSLPIVLGYFGLSIFNMGEVNWTAPGFFGIGILLIKYFDDWKLKPVTKRIWISAAAGLAATLTLVAANPDLVRAAGFSWAYANDPFGRLRGWKTTAEALARHAREFEQETGETPFLISNRYQDCAGPAFYLPDNVAAFRPAPEHPVIQMLEPRDGRIHNQFAFWPRYWEPKTAENRFIGRNALILTETSDRPGPPSTIVKSFAKWELLDSIVIERRGDTLHRWKIFACYDYQIPDGLPGEGSGPER